MAREENIVKSEKGNEPCTDRRRARLLSCQFVGGVLVNAYAVSLCGFCKFPMEIARNTKQQLAAILFLRLVFLLMFRYPKPCVFVFWEVLTCLVASLPHPRF